jgi:hypothetical protein
MSIAKRAMFVLVAALCAVLVPAAGPVSAATGPRVPHGSFSTAGTIGSVNVARRTIVLDVGRSRLGIGIAPDAVIEIDLWQWTVGTQIQWLTKGYKVSVSGSIADSRRTATRVIVTSMWTGVTASPAAFDRVANGYCTKYLKRIEWYERQPVIDALEYYKTEIQSLFIDEMVKVNTAAHPADYDAWLRIWTEAVINVWDASLTSSSSLHATADATATAAGRHMGLGIDCY